jgi:hypothetical protein
LGFPIESSRYKQANQVAFGAFSKKVHVFLQGFQSPTENIAKVAYFGYGFLMDLIIWPLIRLMQMSLFGGRARTWGRQNHFFSVQPTRSF